MVGLSGLPEILRSKGMSNTDLAAAIGVTSTQITAYIKGYRSPALGTLVAMHDILDRSLDEIVFGNEEQQETAKGGSDNGD